MTDPSVTDPFRIFAFAGSSALGDFILYNVYAASVAKSVLNSDLTLYYFDDRSYKHDVFAMNHRADRQFSTTDGVFPIDWFDLATEAPHISPIKDWHEHAVSHTDLVLTPSMMGWPKMGGFENPARLRLSNEAYEEQATKLTEHGVDPNHWFAVIHTKENGYEHRKGSGPARNVDPKTYEAAADYIIDELGGQVVRIGDPTMQAFTKRDGLIDLSRLDEAFLLHACAVQCSRFVMAADSGIHPLGSAMGVPTAVTNLLSVALCWNPHDLLLSKTVVTPDGERVRQQQAFDRGLLNEGVIFHDHTVEDASAEELCQAAKTLLDRTAGCPLWRLPPGDENVTANASREVTLPFESKVRATWMDVG